MFRCSCAAALALLLLAASGCGSYGPSGNQKLRDLFWLSGTDEDIRGLTSEDAVVRRWSIVRLVSRGRTDAAPQIALLVSQRYEEDPTVRCTAAAAMRQMNCREAAGILATSLDDPSSLVRAEIMRSLSAIGGPRHGVQLEKFAGSLEQPAEVRADAIRALAGIGAMDSCSTLIELLEDADSAVRLAAHEALTKLARKDLGTSRADWQHWWDSIQKETPKEGEPTPE